MRGEAQLSSARLAVLIDADNAKPNLIESLLQEIATYGVAYVKRVYSDWTDQRSNAWKLKLHKFAIGYSCLLVGSQGYLPLVSGSNIEVY